MSKNRYLSLGLNSTVEPSRIPGKANVQTDQVWKLIQTLETSANAEPHVAANHWDSWCVLPGKPYIFHKQLLAYHPTRSNKILRQAPTDTRGNTWTNDPFGEMCSLDTTSNHCDTKLSWLSLKIAYPKFQCFIIMFYCNILFGGIPHCQTHPHNPT